MGPLSVIPQGNKHAFVVTDLFSKWTEAFPLKSTNSETLAKVLIKWSAGMVLHCTVIKVPTWLVIQFHLCARSWVYLKLEPQPTTPKVMLKYVERFNCTLKAMLAKTVSEHQQDWNQHIPKPLFTYRTAIHEAMSYVLFHVTFGRSPVLPVDIMMVVPVKQKKSLQLCLSLCIIWIILLKMSTPIARPMRISEWLMVITKSGMTSTLPTYVAIYSSALVFKCCFMFQQLKKAIWRN